MVWDVTSHEYVLASGRRVYANHGLIALSRVLGAFEIGEGCDGPLDYDDGDPWTRAERGEVADHMIALWQAYKDQK